ncbi:type IV pilus biogenesis protein PilM [Metabacillus halosaccharovorans]|uniref:pilus assembly protein PilM n=1 Tax=Metabacillus halosaccharovorans TaxID=930124 RepID=UPI00403D9FCC
MAFRLFSQKQQTVNVYISNYSIQLLELKSVDPLVVHRFYEIYLPEGIVEDGRIKDADKLAMILEQCIQDWGIKRKQVRFITPDAFVSVRKVKVPVDLKDDEIKGYLYLEIGHNIHLPFEEPVFDFVPLQENEKDKEILLFAAPEAIINEYTELLHDLKLEASAADLSALSLYRLLFHQEHVSEKENTLLIEVKLDSMNLSIFEQLKPIFTRHLQLDGMLKNWSYKLDPETQFYYQYEVKEKELMLNHFRDTVKEIEKIINFYRFTLHQGDHQITQIILLGDNPYIDKFMEILQESVTTINVSQPQTKVYTHKNIAVPKKFHTVLGLALKEV